MPDKMANINPHIIYPKDLIQVAESTLKFLEKGRIYSLKDLESNINRSFPINKDFIQILKRPSNQSTEALVLSYNRNDAGVLLNTVLNPELKYSQVIIKGNFKFRDYQGFGEDQFGNTAMFKKIQSSDFSKIIKEIEDMKDIKNYFKLEK